MAETERAQLPPYVPYRTFTTFLDHVRSLGVVPSHIDKSVMASMSGGTQAWLKASLRYMKLMDSDGVPAPQLEKLAFSEGDDRKAQLRNLFRSSFTFLDGNIDLQTTTPQKLRSAISDLGAQGETIEKIVAFMVAMAKDADMHVSTLLTKRTVRRATRQKPGRKEPPLNGSDALSTDDPATDDPPDRYGSMKIIALPKAGGHLTLSGSFNLFDLVGAERELVFAIIDKMNEFAAKNAAREEG